MSFEPALGEMLHPHMYFLCSDECFGKIFTFCPEFLGNTVRETKNSNNCLPLLLTSISSLDPL